MKNNIFSKLLCLLMAGAMVFGLAACAEGETPSSGENQGEEENNTDDNTGENPDEPGDGSTYTVTFHLEGHGNEKPASQKVEKGSYATAPDPAPTDANYTFNGWYTATGESAFDFATEAINKSIHLYADWTPKTALTDTSTALASTATVYVVGDSTACDYSAKLDYAYLPRYGFGTQLYRYLNCNSSQIKNLALSGRSSLSFLEESNYKSDLVPNIKAGDYLIIAFGHNDEKSDDATRYTDPTGSYTEEKKNGSTSFQYNLYENYVKLAKDKGATPILCTPIVRYDNTGSYTGSKVHNTSSGDYAAAVRKLAGDTDTALVDLTELTKGIYKGDNIEAQFFHSHSSYLGEKEEDLPYGRDDTHLNMYGAKVVAHALLTNLPQACPLKASVKTDATNPTHRADYAAAIHDKYERPEYNAPTLGTPLATVSEVGWYKTVLGEVGGASKLNTYTIKYEDDKFTISNAGGTNGKFSDSQDGFGAVFTQLPVNKNFTISAKVKLNATEGYSSTQSGFGIMLRDDMYIDYYSSTINSNFVAAGALGKSAIFKHESGAISAESNATTLDTAKEYTLTLTRKGQNITATFNDGTKSYEKSYLDVKMNLVDSQYMYVCLFANRALEAEFSNIVFTITGDDTQGA